MPKALRYCCYSFVLFVLIIGSIELILTPFVARSSYSFIERTIIEKNLPFKKSPNEYRVFLFGESTMHGSHLHPHSTIDKWMQLYLNNLLEEDEARNYTVYNFGRLGEDSVFISTAFRDTLAYQPDLVVFYSAHNDFIILQHRNDYFSPKSASDRIELFFKDLVKKSRFLSLMKRVSVKARLARHQKRDQLNKDKPQWFDERTTNKYVEGLKVLEPNSSEFAFILDQWQSNIHTIIRKAQKEQVPVVFFNKLSRYPGFEPFLSKHKNNLSPEDKKSWDNIFQLAEGHFHNGDYAVALNLYKAALEIDNHYALLLHRLGECFLKLEQYELAKSHFEQSNDLDYFPIRGPSEVVEFYNNLSKDVIEGTYIIPTQDIFIKHSSSDIITSESLVMDQLHPNIKGQAIMAKEIIHVMEDQEAFGPGVRLNWSNVSNYDALVEQLNIPPEAYFKIYYGTANYVGSYIDYAIENITKALEIKPNSLLAKSKMAWLYYQKGDLESALRIYRAIAKKHPKLADRFFDRQPQIKELLR